MVAQVGPIKIGGESQLGGIPETQARAARASAALMLAALVVLLSWPPRVPPDPRCPHPREVDGFEGWSIDVSCRVPSPRSPQPRGPALILFDQRLDLNQVDARAMQVLPGIGPARAAAIVAARDRRPLQQLSDLEKIRGIGPKTVLGLASWAAAGGEDRREY